MTQATIGSDCLVTLAVQMYDLQGNLLETSPEEGLTYLSGCGDIFPRVEKALEGKKAGDRASLVLQPEDAFGEYDETLVFLCDVEKLGPEGTVQPGLVYGSVPGQADDGRMYRVTDVGGGKAVLDGNHPLAGCGLRLEIKIKSVEPVTEEMRLAASKTPVAQGILSIADRILPESAEDGDDPEEEKHLDEELGRRGAR